MTIKAIWAQARDDEGRPVIGSEGAMPWHLPADLAHFQHLTRGHAVIMGRRTWESLPPRFRPLPGRTNIVVTSLDVLDGAATAGSLSSALELADVLVASGDLAEDATRWIIGGARMFSSAVGLADVLEITEIDLTVAGDTFAPEIPAREWQVDAQTPWSLSDEGLPYRFVTYARRVLSA